MSSSFWASAITKMKCKLSGFPALMTVFVVLWRPPEVSNGVGSAEELYADNGYDYYTNQGISQ